MRVSLPLRAAAALLAVTTPVAASAQGVPEAAPKAPTLTYAFSARITLLPPVEQGEIDGARKRFIPITGGTVTGPRLRGTVLAGGGDWQAILPGGLTRVEARYFLRADDGTVISIHNLGVRVASPEVTDRIARGESVPPDAYYFRSTPVFDAPPGNHGWLRERVFVARGIRMPDHVVIDFYIVE
jgi:hypothetical protein